MSYKIKVKWDPDAAVWIATSKDVPGLVLESGSFDALVERVKNAIPELIELNGEKQYSIKLTYVTWILGNVTRFSSSRFRESRL